MGFAYKKLTPDNVKVNTNEVYKQYKFNNLLDPNISIFVGENIPMNEIDPLFFNEYDAYKFRNVNIFDPHNDTQTTNNEYRRLIFDSVKHLFYKEFIGHSGSLISGSRFEYFPQTSRYSGSYSTTHRFLEDIRGEGFEYITNNYNENIPYDSEYLYDSSSYEPNRGNLISILSISKNLYGNNIKPNTFLYSDDLNYIRDDGEGNIYDFFDEETYNDFLETGEVKTIYIGNIIYSLGIVIITDSRYLCLFNTPPVLLNDYYVINNITGSKEFNILLNDYSDCSSIDYDSMELVNIPGETFPDCYLDNTILRLVDNQSSYIPGIYKIGYKLLSMVGVPSNIATVNLTIKSNPLDVVFTYSRICSNDTSSNIPFSLNISDGVPEYEYSFDAINWTHLSGFGSASIDGYVNKYSSSLYVRDYINETVSIPINPFRVMDYEIIITPSPSCSSTGSIEIISQEPITFSIDSGNFDNIPNTIYPLSEGSHSITLLSQYGCYVEETVVVTSSPGTTFDIDISHVNCFGASTGIINITNVVGSNPPYTFHISSGSYNSTSSLSTNLRSGDYLVTVSDTLCSYSQSVNINTSPLMVISGSFLFEEPCYSTIEVNVSGGVGPYNYTIISPNHAYNTNNNIIPLNFDGIQEMVVSCLINDSLGCFQQTTFTIPGRSYRYVGTYCEDL